MKFDKDTLLKHRFWIILGVSVPLILAGVTVLMTSVSANIALKKGELEKAYGAFKSVPPALKNQEGIEKKRQEADHALQQQNKVWQDAYNAQAPLQTLWPEQVEQRFGFASRPFANEIVINKAPAKVEEWPEDKENLLHGVLEDFKDTYFVVKDRKGQSVRFQQTARPKVSATEDAGGGTGLFYRDLQGHVGKFLAVTYQKGRYFNDRLTDSERNEYARSYKSQIHDLLKIVDPIDRAGKGVVQLRGWTFDPTDYPPPPAPGARFLNYVAAEQWKMEADISDEAWIAQEDLWVQKEIYQLIRAANDSIGSFKRVSGKETDKTQTFQNPYLNLELTLAGDKLGVKATNRLDRRQKIDQLELLVKFHKTLEPERVKLTGLPLEPAGLPDSTRALEINLGAKTQRQGMFAVNQALTWETAAVKRIDHVSVGSADAADVSHGHRTYPAGLRPYIEKKADEAAPPVAAGPMGEGSPMQMSLPPPGLGAGGTSPYGAGGAAGGNKTLLPNGLWTDRYLEVSPQARRLPVAVALIIDQDHVDRVLTSFNNSRLRFLPTQVLLNHYPQTLKPQLLENAGAGFAGGPGGPAALPGMPPGFPGLPAGYPGISLPPRSGSSLGPVAPPSDGESSAPFPGMPAGAGTAAAGGSPDLEANLEIVIYGIVTLYEKFPPRPASAEAPPAETKQ